jgi:membrane protein implicated in regulation of membrane protease activity
MPAYPLYLYSMSSWWSALSGPEQVFWGISIVFSILFLIQFVFSLIGLDFDSETDTDFHADVVDHDFSLDTDFTLLSVRSIIAFFTFFGWTGVLCLNSGAGVWTALGFSSLSGLAAMFLVAYLVYLFSRLTQEGNIDVRRALYETGEVYLTIPANKNGAGKIHIQIEGSYREVDAVTDGDALPTGSKVKVVEVIDDTLLLVERSDSFLREM